MRFWPQGVFHESSSLGQTGLFSLLWVSCHESECFPSVLRLITFQFSWKFEPYYEFPYRHKIMNLHYLKQHFEPNLLENLSLSGTTSAPMIGGSSCARMDTESGLWRSVSCEAQQPYVCKKPLNNTVELTGGWHTFSYVQISLRARAWWSQVNVCQIPIFTYANVLSIPRTHAKIPWLCMFETPGLGRGQCRRIPRLDCRASVA